MTIDWGSSSDNSKTSISLSSGSSGSRNIFKANGQRLKIFLEPEIPELEEVDVYELSELEHTSTIIAIP